MRRIVVALGLVVGATLAAAAPAQAFTYVVTKFDDPAPLFCVPGLDCSLREAVTAANATPEADVVQLAAGTYTLTRDALETVTTNITIQGQGASATIITGADTVAADGFAPAGGVVAVTGASATLTVRALTMRGNRVTGNAGSGAGAIAARLGASVVLENAALRDNEYAASAPNAGAGALSGIEGAVTITDSAIEGNVYIGPGGYPAAGGLAWEHGVATITRSSISRNRADGVDAFVYAGGVAISRADVVTVVDSTVNANSVSGSPGAAPPRAGGITVNLVDVMTLTNVTLTDNTAGAPGAGSGNLLAGAAPGSPSTVTIRNSVLAGGAPVNCVVAGPTVVSAGGNLEDASSCPFTGPGDLVNTDPQLGALRPNGGVGRSQLPLPTSPLFGLARSAFCSATDQRGIARPTGDGCDSGAVESTPPPVATTPPAITGTPASGQTLTCAPGTFSGAPSLAFQWLRDGTAVPGAITASYIVTAADLGTALQCRLTATNAAGSVVATSPAVLPPPAVPGPLPPTNTSRPTFGGPLRTGLKTTCTAGTWTGATGFAFAWLRNGTTIAGAADAAYTLRAADADRALQCRVTATGAGGATVAESAPAVPARACIVPTLVGATLATARTRLTRANCALGRVTRKVSPKAPGLVLSSSPAKGKNLAAGTKVALTLSRR